MVIWWRRRNSCSRYRQWVSSSSTLREWRQGCEVFGFSGDATVGRDETNAIKVPACVRLDLLETKLRRLFSVCFQSIDPEMGLLCNALRTLQQRLLVGLVIMGTLLHLQLRRMAALVMADWMLVL